MDQQADTLFRQAEAEARAGRLAAAEASLRGVLHRAPAHHAARFHLSHLLLAQLRFAEAAAEARKLPAHPEAQLLLITALNSLGEQGEAASLYRTVLEAAPNAPPLWSGYGHVLRMLGERAEAEAAYRKALELQPSFGEAWWALADLKTRRFSAEEIAAMRGQLERGALAPADRAHLLYAYAKALEDEGQAAEAFAAYREGAGLRSGGGDEAGRIEAVVRRTEALLTEEFFAARQGWGAEAADPIFILGMPRSGSTLVEQILASHSAVEATMELSDVWVLARSLAPNGAYLEALPGLSRERAAQLGAAYVDGVAPRRKLGKAHFIDKMPSNWAHIGLIHLMAPNAKIIDVRRHPMACSWSCYKQHFPAGMEYTYDFDQLGRYYAAYVRQMAHVDRVLPGRVHRLIYERLVENPDAEIRALLAYCGLEFEPACLTPHQTQRVVRSVSSEQVRRPISAKGLDDWRTFEPFLDALKRALGPVLDCYPDAPSG